MEPEFSKWPISKQQIVRLLFLHYFPLSSQAEPERPRLSATTAKSTRRRDPLQIRRDFVINSPPMQLFTASPLLTVQTAALGFGLIEMTWVTVLFICAGCLALGYLIGARYSYPALRLLRPVKETQVVGVEKKERGKQPLEVEKLAEILEDFKMVLVVRNDLKMGKGKIAAQCSHATLGLYKKMVKRAPKSLNRWEMCGQVKVVLKIESGDDMLVLQEKAKSLNLPTHITIDAGRTQIAPNSRTVMAILGPADLVDEVTGGLKLL